MDVRLIRKDSKGTTRVWEIWIEDGPPVRLVKSYGVEGGKMQQRVEEILEGKAGRTPLEQAELQLNSAVKKQKDKGYHLEGETYEGPTLPMLAKSYDPAKVTWPCVVQEKLNGIRCVAKRIGDTIRYTSRTGQTFESLEHLTPALLDLMADEEEWDGEIFCPGMALQDISSAVKKPNENTPNLQYWVYDQIEEESFRFRMFEGQPPYDGIVFVQNHRVDNETQLDTIYKQMVSRGAEGIIVRNRDGLYKTGGYRSWDLMKRKDFHDEEFRIVGGTKDVDNCVIWTCETPDGQQFSVVPTGSKESRRLSFREIKDRVGLMLTVRYSEKSTSGIPQGNPVGVVIRDYE